MNPKHECVTFDVAYNLYANFTAQFDLGRIIRPNVIDDISNIHNTSRHVDVYVLFSYMYTMINMRL